VHDTDELVEVAVVGEERNRVERQAHRPVDPVLRRA
jgi:hypothetical protein